MITIIVIASHKCQASKAHVFSVRHYRMEPRPTFIIFARSNHFGMEMNQLNRFLIWPIYFYRLFNIHCHPWGLAEFSSLVCLLAKTAIRIAFAIAMAVAIAGAQDSLSQTHY